ncbi:MAG: YesU family protein [Lachnospiraceae bacterium]|nr:YesU family protein [Lachnospiraceae bacterium]
MENLIYENPLACEEDIRGFRLEGSAKITFPEGRMCMENAISAEAGQKANYVLWCDRVFPDNIKIEWDFRPLKEPGLAILFFAAKGINGCDIFDPSIAPRTGEYPLYHHGDINAFHVSYFRRKEPDERAFHTCNLRKSYGFYLVSQGADPIPDAADCSGSYKLSLIKKKDFVSFSVNDLCVFTYEDDGKTCGDFLTDGRIGFRQLAPMIGEYANLRVFSL